MLVRSQDIGQNISVENGGHFEIQDGSQMNF